jgi:hypothetical protein
MTDKYLITLEGTYLLGVDLFSLKDNQDIWFNWSAWKFLRETARDFGWQPMGTVVNLQNITENKTNLISLKEYKLEKMVEDWNGGYASNDDQIVTAPDAADLLQALTRAVNNRAFWNSIAEESQEVIMEFMEFLKNGAFRIS